MVPGFSVSRAAAPGHYLVRPAAAQTGGRQGRGGRVHCPGVIQCCVAGCNELRGEGGGGGGGTITGIRPALLYSSAESGLNSRATLS